MGQLRPLTVRRSRRVGILLAAVTVIVVDIHGRVTRYLAGGVLTAMREDPGAVGVWYPIGAVNQPKHPGPLSRFQCNVGVADRLEPKKLASTLIPHSDGRDGSKLALNPQLR